MSETTHAAPPVSQRVVYRSTRGGGSVLEIRYSRWVDHESVTIAFLSNGKRLYVGVEPAEVSGLIKALTLLRDARKWKP
jgi:hypothetical protein